MMQLRAEAIRARDEHGNTDFFALLNIAAAEIERLRAALKPLAAIPLWRDQYPDGPEIFPGSSSHLLGTIAPEQVRAARDALKTSND